MQIREFYEAIGSDYQKVFARLCSNELIMKYVNAFSQDESYDKFVTEYQNGNLEEAFRAVYTLKGISLNLGFYLLSKSCIKITEALRGGENGVTPQMIEELTQNYNLVVENIKKIEN